MEEILTLYYDLKEKLFKKKTKKICFLDAGLVGRRKGNYLGDSTLP